MAGELLVNLRAKPVEGAANAALLALIAELSAVAKRDVALMRGHMARSKVVKIETSHPGEALQRLQDAIVNAGFLS